LPGPGILERVAVFVDTPHPGCDIGTIFSAPMMVGERVARGHWSWVRHFLAAERTRPTVVAVTVSGGDLILVIRGPG